MSLLGEVILDRADPSPREEGWCKPRARKVTITEIIDSCGNSSGGSDNDDDCGGRDSGDSAFDEKGGCAAAGDEAVAAQDADEVFKELDGLVQVLARPGVCDCSKYDGVGHRRNVHLSLLLL